MYQLLFYWWTASEALLLYLWRKTGQRRETKPNFWSFFWSKTLQTTSTLQAMSRVAYWDVHLKKVKCLIDNTFNGAARATSHSTLASRSSCISPRRAGCMYEKVCNIRVKEIWAVILLMLLAHAGRPLRWALAAGSIPPEMENLWTRLRQTSGVEVDTYRRGVHGEQGVLDVRLISYLFFTNQALDGK